MNNYRLTKQRKIILEELQGTRCHPTADEIYDRVRQKLPKISLSTVYRNLDFLRQKGLIKVIDIGSGQRRYDFVTDEHQHIRCVECGKVRDIDMDANGDNLTELADKTEFEVLGYNIDIYGICPDCKAKKEEE